MRGLTQIREQDVFASLNDVIDPEEIKGIQITQKECRVTVASQEAKQTVKTGGLNVGSLHVLGMFTLQKSS